MRFEGQGQLWKSVVPPVASFQAECTSCKYGSDYSRCILLIAIVLKGSMVYMHARVWGWDSACKYYRYSVTVTAELLFSLLPSNSLRV